MTDRRIKILFITCFGSLKGGGQRSLYLLIKHLDKEKFEPFLLVPETGELDEAVRLLGVKVYVCPFPRVRQGNILAISRALLGLRHIVKTEKISLIYTDSDRQTFYAGVVGKLTSVPVVLHLRVTDSRSWVDRCLYVLTDKMVAVSRAAADRFGKIDKIRKVDVVYNGIELDVFKPYPKEKKEDVLKIGYFGRIEPRKGIEVLLKAFRLVNDASLEAYIFGDGEVSYVQELKVLAGNSRVVFKGFCQDVCGFMREMDAVILPSHYGEGLSRSVIEAMALGKAVIVSDTQSNPEAVGEDFKDFIFKDNDELGLAALLRRFLADRSILEKVSPKARARAETFFDIEKNTRAIERIYESMARRKP